MWKKPSFFKRKMPLLPDASAFTRFKKLSTIERSRTEDSKKKITKFYEFYPAVTGSTSLTEFLQSVSKPQVANEGGGGGGGGGGGTLTWEAVSGYFFDFQGSYILYNGVDRWVAVGYDTSGKNILTSTDGQTWSAGTDTIFSDSGNFAAYGAGKWVAVGIGTSPLLTSNNGTNWSAASGSIFEQGKCVAYANNKWVAVGADTTANNRILISDSGTTWSSSSGVVIDEVIFVAYGGGKWVAIGYDADSKTIQYSTDNGANWFETTGDTFSNSGTCVAYDGVGRWVATGSGTNALLTSTDGIAWTAISGVDNSFKFVAYKAGRWIAVGATSAGNTILTSTNGTSWAPVLGVQFSAYGNYVTYANGRWVATGADITGNNILTSTDGITWETVKGTTFVGQGFSVAYGNGVWCSVGQKGKGTVTMLKALEAAQ